MCDPKIGEDLVRALGPAEPIGFIGEGTLVGLQLLHPLLRARELVASRGQHGDQRGSARRQLDDRSAVAV